MTNYSRGANFERAVKEKLEADGYFVVRAAGSHGLVDLVAIAKIMGPFDYNRPWFIQAKTNGKMKPSDRADLIALGNKYGAHAVMAWRPRRGEVRLAEVKP